MSTHKEDSHEAASGPALTFEAAAARYLSSRVTIGLKAGTISDYECHLRVHLLPAFGRRQLTEIRPEQIEVSSSDWSKRSRRIGCLDRRSVSST